MPSSSLRILSSALVVSAAVFATPASAALDPDVPPPAAAATAPRLTAAQAYAVPFYRQFIAQATTDQSLGDGFFLAELEDAFIGTDLVDLEPVRTLLADSAVVDRYVTGGSALNCDADPTTFAANAQPLLLADIVLARARLDVTGDLFRTFGCNPRDTLNQQLADPDAFAGNTGAGTFFGVMRELLQAGVHVRAAAIDTLIETATDPARLGIYDQQTKEDGLLALALARDAGYGGTPGPIRTVAKSLGNDQAADGSLGAAFVNGPVTSSTAHAAVAFAAAGETERAQRAASWITRVQVDAADATVPADVGAIGGSYPFLAAAATQPGGIGAQGPDFARSTASAIPGLIAGAYAPATAPTSPAATAPAAAAPPATSRPAPTNAAPAKPVVRVVVGTQRASILTKFGSIYVRVRLDQAARGTVRLGLSRLEARRIGLRIPNAFETLAGARVTRTQAGTTAVRLKVPARIRRAIRKAHRDVTFRLEVSVRGAAGTTKKTARVVVRD